MIERGVAISTDRVSQERPETLQAVDAIEDDYAVATEAI